MVIIKLIIVLAIVILIAWPIQIARKLFKKLNQK